MCPRGGRVMAGGESRAAPSYSLIIAAPRPLATHGTQCPNGASSGGVPYGGPCDSGSPWRAEVGPARGACHTGGRAIAGVSMGAEGVRSAWGVTMAGGMAWGRIRGADLWGPARGASSTGGRLPWGRALPWGPSTVGAWVRGGRIPGVTVGQRYRGDGGCGGHVPGVTVGPVLRGTGARGGRLGTSPLLGVTGGCAEPRCTTFFRGSRGLAVIFANWR